MYDQLDIDKHVALIFAILLVFSAVGPFASTATAATGQQNQPNQAADSDERERDCELEELNKEFPQDCIQEIAEDTDRYEGMSVLYKQLTETAFWETNSEVKCTESARIGENKIKYCQYTIDNSNGFSDFVNFNGIGQSQASDSSKDGNVVHWYRIVYEPDSDEDDDEQKLDFIDIPQDFEATLVKSQTPGDQSYDLSSNEIAFFEELDRIDSDFALEKPGDVPGGEPGEDPGQDPTDRFLGNREQQNTQGSVVDYDLESDTPISVFASKFKDSTTPDELYEQRNVPVYSGSANGDVSNFRRMATGEDGQANIYASDNLRTSFGFYRIPDTTKASIFVDANSYPDNVKVSVTTLSGDVIQQQKLSSQLVLSEEAVDYMNTHNSLYITLSSDSSVSMDVSCISVVTNTESPTKCDEGKTKQVLIKEGESQYKGTIGEIGESEASQTDDERGGSILNYDVGGVQVFERVRYTSTFADGGGEEYLERSYYGNTISGRLKGDISSFPKMTSGDNNEAAEISAGVDGLNAVVSFGDAPMGKSHVFVMKYRMTDGEKPVMYIETTNGHKVKIDKGNIKKTSVDQLTIELSDEVTNSINNNGLAMLHIQSKDSKTNMLVYCASIIATPAGEKVDCNGSTETGEAPDDGGEGTENFKPQTSLSVEKPSQVTTETEVTFSASDVYDRDGSISSYKWKINGKTYFGKTLSHTFENGGDHNVQLVVKDNDGATATATTSISVKQATFTYYEYTQVDTTTRTKQAVNSPGPDWEQGEKIKTRTVKDGVKTTTARSSPGSGWERNGVDHYTSVVVDTKTRQQHSDPGSGWKRAGQVGNEEYLKNKQTKTGAKPPGQTLLNLNFHEDAPSTSNPGDGLDTLSDFTSVMNAQSDGVMGEFENHGPKIRWSQAGTGDDYIKYTKNVPNGVDDLTLDLEFAGRSFEASGVAFYAVDSNGDKHYFKCDEDGVIDCGGMGQNDGGNFVWDGVYTVTTDAQFERFVVESDMADCCYDGGDSSDLYELFLSTGKWNKGQDVGVQKYVHNYKTTRQHSDPGNGWRRVQKVDTQVGSYDYRKQHSDPGSGWEKVKKVGTEVYDTKTRQQHSDPGSGWKRAGQVGTEVYDTKTRQQHSDPGSGWERAGKVGEEVYDTQVREQHSDPGSGWERAGKVGEEVYNTKTTTSYKKPGSGWTKVGVASDSSDGSSGSSSSTAGSNTVTYTGAGYFEYGGDGNKEKEDGVVTVQKSGEYTVTVDWRMKLSANSGEGDALLYVKEGYNGGVKTGHNINEIRKTGGTHRRSDTTTLSMNLESGDTIVMGCKLDNEWSGSSKCEVDITATTGSGSGGGSVPSGEVSSKDKTAAMFQCGAVDCEGSFQTKQSGKVLVIGQVASSNGKNENMDYNLRVNGQTIHRGVEGSSDVSTTDSVTLFGVTDVGSGIHNVELSGDRGDDSRQGVTITVVKLRYYAENVMVRDCGNIGGCGGSINTDGKTWVLGGGSIKSYNNDDAYIHLNAFGRTVASSKEGSSDYSAWDNQYLTSITGSGSGHVAMNLGSEGGYSGVKYGKVIAIDLKDDVRTKACRTDDAGSCDFDFNPYGETVLTGHYSANAGNNEDTKFWMKINGEELAKSVEGSSDSSTYDSHGLSGVVDNNGAFNLETKTRDDGSFQRANVVALSAPSAYKWEKQQTRNVYRWEKDLTRPVYKWEKDLTRPVYKWEKDLTRPVYKWEKDLTRPVYKWRNPNYENVYEWRKPVVKSQTVYEWTSKNYDTRPVYKWEKDVTEQKPVYEWTKQQYKQETVYQWEKTVKKESQQISLNRPVGPNVKSVTEKEGNCDGAIAQELNACGN